MKNFLLKLLNGALGQREYEELDPENMHWPDGGIVRAPQLLDLPSPSSKDYHCGPECHFLVKVGDLVKAGQAIAQFDSPTIGYELVAPCNALIAEFLVDQGQPVDPDQAILRLEKI